MKTLLDSKDLSDIHNLIHESKYSDLETLCRKKLKKKNKATDIITYLCFALVKQGKTQKAIEQMQVAVSIAPNNPELHFNLGNLYYRAKQFANAKRCFELVIAMKSDFADALHGLGNCLVKQGKLNEASQHYVKALELDSSNAQYYLNFFQALILLQSPHDAELVAHLGLEKMDATRPETNDLLIRLAALEWILGKIDEAEKHLKKCCNLQSSFPHYPNLQNMNAFYNLLVNLIQIRKNSNLYSGKPTKPIFFVSESHCLAPSDLAVTFQGTGYRILSCLITGCKAWHLGDSNDNEYKESLNILLSALPKESIVVSGFGEIDCRHDEGILAAYKNKRIDPETGIPPLVRRYLDYVCQTAHPYGHSVILYGVPSPNPSFLTTLSPSDSDLLVTIIRRFNDSLKQLCYQRNIPLLDVYQATSTCALDSSLCPYVDHHHLHPQLIAQLFETI